MSQPRSDSRDSMLLQTATGGYALILGTSHVDGSGASAERIRSAIRLYRPPFVVVELDLERAGATAVSHSAYPHAERAYTSLKCAVFSAATSFCASSTASMLGINPAGDGDMATAMAEAATVGATIVLGDRPFALTLARWGRDPVAPITWRETLLRATPAALTHLVLAPNYEPSLRVLMEIALYTARRNWPALAQCMRDVDSACRREHRSWADSPIGTAASQWNALVARRVNHGSHTLHNESEAEASEATLPRSCCQPAALLAAWQQLADSEADTDPPALALAQERDLLLASAIKYPPIAADGLPADRSDRARRVVVPDTIDPPSLSTGSPSHGEDCAGAMLPTVDVVAVVGSSHVRGIAAAWGTARSPEDLVAVAPELMRAPPWHAVTSVAMPAAAAIVAVSLAGHRLRMARPLIRRGVVVLGAGIGLAVATLADGVRALQRRLAAQGT